MPWQPGQSGNPAGRPPKSKALSEVLNELLNEPFCDSAEITNREHLCRVMVKSALDGNLKAVAWVADRAEGRVAQMTAEPNALLHVPIHILTYDGDPSMANDEV